MEHNKANVRPHDLNDGVILQDIQIKLLHFILLFLSAVLLLSAFYNWLSAPQYFIVGEMEFFLSFVCLSAYIASKKLGYRSAASWVAVLVSAFIIIFLIMIVGGSGDTYTLVLLFTLIAYALLGIKEGTLANAFFIAILAVLLFNGYAPQPSTKYNVLITLIFGGGIVYYFEYTKESALQRLQELNKNLEANVQKGIEELRAKDKIVISTAKKAAMGEMIGAISHQWKQPLNALGLMIQDIKEVHQLSELDEPYLNNFVDNGMEQIQFMSHTINDFRNFLKPDKKKELFLVHEAVNEVLHILDKDFRNHGIQVNFSFDNIKSENYKGELEQVILCLLSNAKDELVEKKLSDKEFTPCIDIEIKTGESNNIITISDNGSGIPEENLPKIFESHFTTKPDDKGTGIGLYIAKMIVENSLGRTISVENRESGGACFTLTC